MEIEENAEVLDRIQRIPRKLFTPAILLHYRRPERQACPLLMYETEKTAFRKLPDYVTFGVDYGCQSQLRTTQYLFEPGRLC